MHEIGEGVPHRERFAIPRDNLPNRRRKQMREQFMRRTRLVLKDSINGMNGKIVGTKPLFVALAQRKEERRDMLMMLAIAAREYCVASIKGYQIPVLRLFLAALRPCFLWTKCHCHCPTQRTWVAV